MDTDPDDTVTTAVNTLLDMGFAQEESRRALSEAGGKPEAALALLAQAILAQSAAASASALGGAACEQTAGGPAMHDSASPQAEVDDEDALQIEGAWTKVRALRPGLKGVNMVVIVLEAVGGPIRTAQGSTVQTWLVADETAAVELALYDQHAHAFAEGAILRLLDGYRWGSAPGAQRPDAEPPPSAPSMQRAALRLGTILRLLDSASNSPAPPRPARASPAPPHPCAMRRALTLTLGLLGLQFALSRRAAALCGHKWRHAAPNRRLHDEVRRGAKHERTRPCGGGWGRSVGWGRSTRGAWRGAAWRRPRCVSSFDVNTLPLVCVHVA